MMYPKTLVYLFILCVSTQLFAQESYFQQQCDYTINVQLNDSSHTLLGHLSLNYRNNSPDTLSFIYFHLWPNAYSSKTSAFALQQLEMGSTRFHYAQTEEMGYMDQLEFKVDDIPSHFSREHDCDIIKLILPHPLIPHQSITISTPFRVKIPASFSRLGHTGQDYQISQWYPKPAVYDNAGWHQMPYLDMGEFYSEFGHFDVSITLPKDYLCAATGNLKTEKEVRWLQDLAKAKCGSDSLPSPFLSKEKTIRYSEDNIHDFAWFASKQYHVDVDTLIIPDGGDTIQTMAFYHPNKAIWTKATHYINDALSFYSTKYMPYPYKTCTAVDGSLLAGGGMEYPTITVIGATSNATLLETTIMHEVGHNWFYGILGFNERDYPWLDEGLNSFSEGRYMMEKYPKLKAYQAFGDNENLARLLNFHELSYHQLPTLVYQIQASLNTDQPANLKSTAYNEANYYSSVYMKNQGINNLLMQSMGEESYDKMMQSFFRKWAFKHPQAEDYFHMVKSFNPMAENWYIQGLLGSRKRLDYKVTSIKGQQICLANKGDIAAPLQIRIRDMKSDTSFWLEGFHGTKTIDAPLPVSSVHLYDLANIPEFRTSNNQKGKAANKLNISYLQLLKKDNQRQVGVLPLLAWNTNNGLMTGVFLHNPILPLQKFEYDIAPLYGIKNQGLAGFGNVKINFRSDALGLNRWSMDVHALRFAYDETAAKSFNKLRARLSFHFVPDDARIKRTSNLSFAVQRSSLLEDIVMPSTEIRLNTWFLASLKHSTSSALSYTNYRLNLDADKRFGKMAFAFYHHDTPFQNVHYSIRFHGAYFLYHNQPLHPLYKASMNAYTGQNDYLFDHLYFDRFSQAMPGSANLLSQQMSPGNGGFISYLPQASSSDWLSTLNFTLSLPKIPGEFYANLGTYSGITHERWHHGGSSYAPNAILTEGGWALSFGPIKVYLPIWGSYLNGHEYPYWQTIRYAIRMDALVNLRKHPLKIF